jgi:hypothetical protein
LRARRNPAAAMAKTGRISAVKMERRILTQAKFGNFEIGQKPISNPKSEI